MVRLIVPPGVFVPPSDARLLTGLLREHAAGRHVLDVCTGSGFLAVSAALAGARRVTAVDISRRALAATRLNAVLNRVRVKTRRGDLLDSLGVARYDLIVSNPPYLPALHDREPNGLARATEAGFDGRRFLDRLIDQAPAHLRGGGAVLLVHSSINGIEATCQRLRAVGLESDVPSRVRGPLGPILLARAGLLEQRGLLEPGVREEEIAVVRGTAPR